MHSNSNVIDIVFYSHNNENKNCLIKKLSLKKSNGSSREPDRLDYAEKESIDITQQLFETTHADVLMIRFSTYLQCMLII
jgi:hypothetical protein